MKYQVATAVLVVMACVAGSVSYAAPAPDVVSEIQKRYDAVRSVQSSFEQIYTSKRFGEKRTRGKVTFEKPGKMRWDYDDPKGRVLLSDGYTIMLYDPEDRQALSGPQPKKGGLPVALSFLWGEGKLDQAFTVTILKDETSKQGRVVTLHCVPKESIPNVAHVELDVRIGESTYVLASRVADQMGGTNEIRFADVRLNPKLNESSFRFQPPKGTPIVPFGDIDVKPQ